MFLLYLLINGKKTKALYISFYYRIVVIVIEAVMAAKIGYLGKKAWLFFIEDGE